MKGRILAGAGGAWTLGALAVLGLVAGPADAQLSGSVRVGSSRSSTTVNGGRVDSRSTSGGVDIAFGRGAGYYDSRYWATSGAGSPYGRPGYGRGPGYNYGDPFGSYGYDGVHSSTWSGLIDQNFQQMRRTSPFPWRFAGGAYNPHPSRIHSRFGSVFYYPSFGNFYYGGYAFGFGPSFYGSYVPSIYSYYGSWYPPYLPTDRVIIIERERPRDDDDDSSYDSTRARRERAEPEEEKSGSSTDDGSYYLSPRAQRTGGDTAPVAGESLSDAVAAIRSAWMNGDAARLQARIARKGRVRIYLSGKYKYSVDANDFGQMTKDAMERIDTIAFTLDHVEKRGDDRAFVSGKHTYNDPERQKHEVYVSYGLVREQGRWKIAEAGSGPKPITSHTD